MSHDDARPDLLSAQPPDLLPLPVTAATLLEDRAELTRSHRLGALPAGVHRLRLGPVTPLVVDHSLRGELVGVPGGRVLDLRVVRRWTPQPPAAVTGGPGEDASATERQVHDLSERLRRADLEVDRLVGRVAVLEQLLGDLHRAIAEGVGSGEAQPRSWAQDLDRAEAAHEEHAEALRDARFRRGRLKEQLIRAQQAWEEAESRPMVLSAHIEASVELPAVPVPVPVPVSVPVSAPASVPGSVPAPASASGEDVRLEIRHLTPCALWRPAYRATLEEDGPEQPRLLLERDAFVWQRTGEPWHDVRVTLSTARPARAAEPPYLVPDVITLRERSGEERRTVEVDLREVEIPDIGPADLAEQPAPPTALSSVLPGVDDGGEARSLTVPQPLSVPSDGRAHRVTLGGATATASVELSCAPELAPVVVRTVRFRHASAEPLLSGPVDLVRRGGFVGRAELRFTAPGATAEIGFGSEDTFRAARSVTETRETGALSGRSVRGREVGVTLSRFAPPGAGPVRVVIRERIPVSEVSGVEIRVAKERTVPTPDAVDADGVVRWELTLAPEERRALLLRYDIVAGRGVTLPD
ncbi:mucoidy inhibitor MuiA family protein [Streptacidiphilus neutrinimicus]|uniref:mucoidy inhibitor MuiA family protein n=1 Tax=Streptacidiphilus neutrinimicus TaxID=105420 RepID=UPI0005A9C8BF|nr:mucoidy inhibitor MuiA family protein [Streptacidiphilus neutrinimicus]